MIRQVSGTDLHLIYGLKFREFPIVIVEIPLFFLSIFWGRENDSSIFLQDKIFLLEDRQATFQTSP